MNAVILSDQQRLIIFIGASTFAPIYPKKINIFQQTTKYLKNFFKSRNV